MKLVKQVRSTLTTYRKNHIVKILETFDKEHIGYGKNVPIDIHLRKYFLSYKTVSNIDREYIYNQINNLIRYRTLLDFVLKEPLTWEKRLDFYFSDKFDKQLDNVNLPEYRLLN
jgi:hypothetical protein